MKNSSTIIAFITALALHLIVGGVLLMNVDLSFTKEKIKSSTPVIQASVVDQKLFDDLAQRKKDKQLADKRRIEKARQEKERIKRAEAKRKKQEADRIKAEKAEIVRKKKEAQRIQAEKVLAAKKLKAKQEAAKAKKLADDKRRKQEAERKKAEAKRKKQEAQRIQAEKAAKAKAAKIKAEKEAKAKAAKIKAEKEAKRRAEAEKERLRQAELDRQMESEFEDAFSSAQNSKQLSEIARYKALIENKISRNWQVDPDMKGKTCTLAIRLAPDGLVLSAERSRGDVKMCASARRAALKAKTLPIPKDPKIAPQFRDFDITLEPDL
ncbi:cell envelope integrity protein TolA [Psychromonas aquimarina]|uniref:cell envelope integrity protein TolA n=1 Tax=Psychromonas aquimarina TaxID=444919 RepID=UPI000405099B|nr:cell envelope integrity protein TolA [Psychromonas aquimarina]